MGKGQVFELPVAMNPLLEKAWGGVCMVKSGKESLTVGGGNLGKERDDWRGLVVAIVVFFKRVGTLRQKVRLGQVYNAQRINFSFSTFPKALKIYISKITGITPHHSSNECDSIMWSPGFHMSHIIKMLLVNS